MFGTLIFASFILFLFLLFPGRKKLQLVFLLVVSLVFVAVWAPCSDVQGRGEVKVNPGKKNYLLRQEAPARPEKRAYEHFGMEETFPLYGSREERIFKPWLKLFYYGKNTGFRLNVEYESETDDNRQ
jgi:hypothetical protein